MPRTVETRPLHPAGPDGVAPAGRTTVGVNGPQTASKLSGDEGDGRTARSFQRRSRPFGLLRDLTEANPAGEGLYDPASRHAANGSFKSGATGGRGGMGYESALPGAADSEAAQ
jgi:hypothetical protein